MRRRHGHHVVRPGHLREPLLRRAEPVQPRPRAEHPRGVPGGGGGRGGDQHVRGAPVQAGSPRVRRAGAPDQLRGGPPGRGGRAPAGRPGGGLDGPAGQAHGAPGHDLPRRRHGGLRGAGSRPGGGRRRPVHGRDPAVPGPGPGGRGGDPPGVGGPHRGLPDVHRGGHDVLRRQAGGHRAHRGGLGSGGGGGQLQPGAAAHARDHAAHGLGGHAGEALRDAERRCARAGGRPLRVPLHAGIHGLLRPAVPVRRGELRGRLLRDDPLAHPQPRALGADVAARPGRW